MVTRAQLRTSATQLRQANKAIGDATVALMAMHYLPPSKYELAHAKVTEAMEFLRLAQRLMIEPRVDLDLVRQEWQPKP